MQKENHVFIGDRAALPDRILRFGDPIPAAVDLPPDFPAIPASLFRNGMEPAEAMNVLHNPPVIAPADSEEEIHVQQ